MNATSLTTAGRNAALSNACSEAGHSSESAMRALSWDVHAAEPVTVGGRS